MDVPVPSRPEPAALDHQIPGTLRPPRRRVHIVTLSEGGMRYTDPAATWRDRLPEILHGRSGRIAARRGRKLTSSYRFPRRTRIATTYIAACYQRLACTRA